MDGYNEDFWKALDELVCNSEIVIDRPRGSAHPRFPNFIYEDRLLAVEQEVTDRQIAICGGVQ